MMRNRIYQAVAGVAGTLLLLASLTGRAAAAEVSNDSGGALVAQAAWGEVEFETGAGDWGMVVASIQDGQSLLFLYEQSAVAVLCDAGTPGDPSDDYAGLQGTLRTAVGPGAVDIAANLKAATASAVLSIETVVFDDCTMQRDVVAVAPGSEVSLELSATGERDSWIDQVHEKMPGEFNLLAIIRSVSESASGTLTIGDEVSSVEHGLISRNRWNGHFNGR